MSTTETVKSTYITNRDASPVKGTGASIAGGRVNAATGFVTTATTATTASYYPILSVPSNARISSLNLRCEALGTSCTANIGVFCPTTTTQELLALNSAYTNAAAISSAFFASVLDVSAALGRTDILNQSTTNTIAKQEKELWDALGLASDPNCMLDISMTLGAATVAGGKVQLEVAYVF